MAHAVPSWLDRDDLDPIAASFARLLWRRTLEQGGAAHADALARIGALLCLERARGHSCVNVQDWAGRELGIEASWHDAEPLPRLPYPEAWHDALEASRLVGNGTAPSVLVQRSDASVALYRDDAAERRLAAAFVTLLRDRRGPIELDTDTCAAFAALFGEAAPVGQALAAAAALRSRLCVITGGPGTGKTTTVVRILALLLSARPGLRIAVCAPTGKAAARLKKSLDDQRMGLPVPDGVRASLELEVVTVHRLLGYRPREERFARGPHHPLDADVVVVDEASMLDLGLVDALVAALGAQTRLVLLGDRDQLASVDAGSVLTDLVASVPPVGDARSEAFTRWALPLFAASCPQHASADPRSDAVVELRHNFRFAEQPGIAALAEALRAGDADAALDVLADPASPEAVRVDPPARVDALAVHLDPLLEPLGAQATGEIAVRLDRIERGMRVLTALRRGPWGVEGLNRVAEQRLRARGWDLSQPWYEGRPVLIARNAPELDLHNGDLGVVIATPDDPQVRVLALRSTAERGWRTVAMARLPEHDTAWSMTVHKSQGSEFERVVLVLPPGRHPLLSRELLYTGVTRARGRVTVIGTAATVRAAVEQVEHRRSGLALRLREAFEAPPPRDDD